MEAADPEPAEGENASFGAELFRVAAVAALSALQQSQDHRCLRGQCHRYTAGFKCAGVASPFTRSNDRSQCSQCSHSPVSVDTTATETDSKWKRAVEIIVMEHVQRVQRLQGITAAQKLRIGLMAAEQQLTADIGL